MNSPDRTANTSAGLVSVIIPAYNAAACIRSTINSVIDQTYTAWELVVANDASTDETAEIVRTFSESDPRIRLIDVPPRNGLAARARNHAMAHAKGTYFALLDADDEWTPEKLQVQADYLENHAAVDGVCSWYDYFGDPDTVALHNQLKITGRTPGLSDNVVCKREEIIRSCPFLTSTVMFRRKCYEETGGMDEDERLRSGQDYEFFARLLTRYAFHRIPKVLMHYRLAAENNSLSSRMLSAKNAVGWNIYTVLIEKSILTRSEARQKRGWLYFDQAKNNLFRLDAPFRKPLLKSMMTGAPPREAVVMLLLSVLPRRMLIGLLTRMLALARKIRSLRKSPKSRASDATS